MPTAGGHRQGWSASPTGLPMIRRWRFAEGAAVVTVLVTVLLTIFFPPKYSATAQAFVSLAPRSAAETDPFAGSQFVLQRLESYARLGTSAGVLNAVVQELGIEETADQLRSRVTSTNPPDTVLLNVVVVDENPERAAAIADAIVVQQALQIESLESDGGPAGASPVRVTPVEAAAAPDAKGFGARLLRNVLLGACAGLLVPAGAVLVRGYARRPPAGPRPSPGRHSAPLPDERGSRRDRPVQSAVQQPTEQRL